VDKSLVRRTGDRFWMLETIRQFAGERLEQAADAEEIRGHHARYFTRLAEQFDALGGGAGANALQHGLEEDQPNLRAALEWACGGDGHAAVALRLSGALWGLWWNLGSAHEGAGWYARALDVGRDQAETLRARAEYGAANMAMTRNDLVEAIELLERCLAVFRRDADSLRTVRALNDLGIAAQMGGDAVVGRRYHEEALALAERSGLAHLAASARTNLANASLADGRLDEAAEVLTDLIGSMTPSDHAPTVSTAFQTLSMIDLQRNDTDRAAAHVTQSITLGREAHDWRTLAHALPVAAAVQVRRGKVEDGPPRPRSGRRAVGGWPGAPDPGTRAPRGNGGPRQGVARRGDVRERDDRSEGPRPRCADRSRPAGPVPDLGAAMGTGFSFERVNARDCDDLRPDRAPEAVPRSARGPSLPRAHRGRPVRAGRPWRSHGLRSLTDAALGTSPTPSTIESVGRLRPSP
jgi:tetratricopeptide (TPR) repeat protein